MTSRLVALCFDANDPLRLARFWADALHWEIDEKTHDEIGLVPTDDTRFGVLFLAVPEQKPGKNRIHLDLTTTSIDDQKATVERLVELGARHIDVGQGSDAPHVVLADPEGNELCVIEPDNACRVCSARVRYRWPARADCQVGRRTAARTWATCISLVIGLGRGDTWSTQAWTARGKLLG